MSGSACFGIKTISTEGSSPTRVLIITNPEDNEHIFTHKVIQFVWKYSFSTRPRCVLKPRVNSSKQEINV